MEKPNKMIKAIKHSKHLYKINGAELREKLKGIKLPHHAQWLATDTNLTYIFLSIDIIKELNDLWKKRDKSPI